jgi:hypothetical protein
MPARRDGATRVGPVPRYSDDGENRHGSPGGPSSTSRLASSTRWPCWHLPPRPLGEWCGCWLIGASAPSGRPFVPVAAVSDAAGPSCLPLAAHGWQRWRAVLGCSPAAHRPATLRPCRPTAAMGRLGAGRPSHGLGQRPRQTPEADGLSGRFGVAASRGSGEAPRWGHYPPRTARDTRPLRRDRQPPSPASSSPPAPPSSCAAAPDHHRPLNRPGPHQAAYAARSGRARCRPGP